MALMMAAEWLRRKGTRTSDQGGLVRQRASDRGKGKAGRARARALSMSMSMVDTAAQHPARAMQHAASCLSGPSRFDPPFPCLGLSAPSSSLFSSHLFSWRAHHTHTRSLSTCYNHARHSPKHLLPPPSPIIPRPNDHSFAKPLSPLLGRNVPPCAAHARRRPRTSIGRLANSQVLVLQPEHSSQLPWRAHLCSYARPGPRPQPRRRPGSATRQPLLPFPISGPPILSLSQPTRSTNNTR